MNHFNLLTMKQFLKTTTTLLTLSALVACGEDAAMEDALNLSNGKNLERISITGQDFLTEGGMRSMVNINNEGVNFLWSANDTVGIFPNTGFQAPFAMDEGAGMQTATFNGGGWALKASSTYAAYYPFNFYNRDMTKIPVSYEHQTQTGNASTAHLGAYDFMAASVTTPTNGIVAFDMQHMGALVMFQAELDEAKTLTGVSVKASSDVFTTTGVVDLTAVTPSIAAKTTTSILALPLNDFTVSENETSTIYFMMVPANLEGETLEVKLFYKGGSGIKYEIVGKNFVAGKAYGYTLTDGENLNHPEYAVDLGLPSGTLWADRNVGADSPEAYGDYFAWGETEPKDYYYWTTYKWCNGSSSTMTKYCTRSSYGTVDGKTVLDLEDDAACVNMGIEWRMPTLDEFKELYNNCSWTWTTLNGVTVYKVTGPNNNSIILPAAGYRSSSSLSSANYCRYYWSSSLYEPSPQNAYSFCNQSSAYNWLPEERYYGQPVRAVVR